MKVSSIEWLLVSRICETNYQNYDFDDLTFDGDKRLIARWQLYGINDYIVFNLINSLRVYV